MRPSARCTQLAALLLIASTLQGCVLRPAYWGGGRGGHGSERHERGDRAERGERRYDSAPGDPGPRNDRPRGDIGRRGP